MNACILAGGTGSRLRPLTCTRPKPMVSLFDRPMLTYTLERLNQAGVKHCFITLMYLPDKIPSYFGDRYGDMELIYHVEEASMGSAGGILAFREALKDDDFLVVSGDAVFDYDLTKAISIHKASEKSATIMVAHAQDPTPFGVVEYNEEGTVIDFIEKPSWEQVTGGMVSTGLYVMSPSLLNLIPSDQPFDFSRDLFPLLQSNHQLGAVSLPGYWRDAGTPEAFLSVMRDGLDGHWKIPLPISSAVPSSGISVVPPCYLSPKARISKGVKLGPYSVIGEHAIIEPNVSISHSYVNGKVEEGASLFGSITDKGSRIGTNTTLLGGCIVGEGALLGPGCLVENNVHIWCHAVVERGSHLFHDQDAAGLLFRHRIQLNQGHIHHLHIPDLSDLAYSLYHANIKEIVIGYEKSNATACVNANCFTSVFLTCGGKVICHDAACAATAAWIGTRLNTVLSLWFFGDSLLLFNSVGRIIQGDTLHFPILSYTHSDEITPEFPHFLTGVDLLFQKSICHSNRFPLHVSSNDPKLIPILQEIGAIVSTSKHGIPLLSTDLYGTALQVTDEKGYALTRDETTLLLLLCSFLSGYDIVCIPDWVPAAAEGLASAYGKQVKRTESSSDVLPDFFCYGASAALLVLSTLSKTNQSLSALSASIPPCFTFTKSFRVPDGRVAALNRFQNATREYSRYPGKGVRIGLQGSSVWLHASAMEDFMVLKTESSKEEMAKELCDFYYHLLTSQDLS